MTQATRGAFSDKQLSAIAAAHKRVTLWDGAVRSGKTFAWIFLILSKISNHSGVGGIVIVGKNRDSIYRNVFEPIEQNDEFELFREDVKYRQGAAFATIFGKKVHVIGANDAGSENRIRGMTLALAFCDELTVLHVQFFKQLLARLSVSGAQLFGTTNPDTPGHWLMTDYLSKIPGSRHFKASTPEPDQLPDWLYRHFTMEDNPSLDESYKASLRREYTGVWYRRFILGEWVAADGAIYDFFDTHKNVVEPKDIPPIERTISFGIDYGTTHPTAGMMIGIGTDNKLYVTHEWAPNHSDTGNVGMTDGELSKNLQRWLADKPEPEYIYVDPAAKSFRLQLYDDGFPGLKAAKNNVLDGIRTVATLLANGDLLISSDCERLIEEIPGYRWDDKATERGEEKPIKVQDDYCLTADAIINTPNGDTPISDIEIGDEVLTRDGYQIVTDSCMTSPNAKIKRVEFSDGTVINGTGNHPVFIESKGWTPIDEIESGDEVKKWSLNQSSLMEPSSADTQMRNNRHISATTVPVSQTHSEEFKRFIKKCGSSIMGFLKSRMDTTSTTGTATITTTRRRIWNLLKGLPTCVSTLQNVGMILHSVKLPKSVSMESGARRHSGIVRKRDCGGTQITGKCHWESYLSAGMESANSAEKGMKPTLPTEGIGSAQTSASQHGGEMPGSMTLTGNASTVQGSSESTSIPLLSTAPVSVVRVTEVGNAPVYNLTVDGNHEYLANGIAVHNCDSLRYAVFSTRHVWKQYLRN